MERRISQGLRPGLFCWTPPGSGDWHHSFGWPVCALRGRRTENNEITLPSLKYSFGWPVCALRGRRTENNEITLPSLKYSFGWSVGPLHDPWVYTPFHSLDAFPDPQIDPAGVSQNSRVEDPAKREAQAPGMR